MLNQLLAIKKSREKGLRNRSRRLHARAAEIAAETGRMRDAQREVRAAWQAASDAERAVESHLLYRYRRELSGFYEREQQFGDRIRALDEDASECQRQIHEVQCTLNNNMKGQEKLGAVMEGVA